MASQLPARLVAERPLAPPPGVAALVPNATALLAVIACLIALALTRVLGNIMGESGGLHVAGGLVILGLPAAFALARGALCPTGAEGWPAFAFYLSMYHAPLVRLLFGGRPLDDTEVRVLGIALFASAVLSCIVSLRPGAFDPGRAAPPALDNYDEVRARRVAYAGIGTALVGYCLLVIWIARVGLNRMETASLGDVYLYTGYTTVTFQWPFIVGGIITTAVAFARWPGRGAPLVLRAILYSMVVFYALVNARLGARGPTLELCGAIYFVSYGTRRPLSRRTVVVFAPAFAFFFFFVSAMRAHLDSGIRGTSLDEVSVQAQASIDADSASEFDAVFMNSTLIVQFAGTQIPYLYGESWSDLPLQLVPRQLVRKKPPGLSSWWIQYIDPTAAAQGAGRAFGSFAEGYLNFGPIGAVMQVGAVTAFLIALLPMLRSRRFWVAAAAAATLAHGYHLHRSEIFLSAFTLRNALLVGLASILLLKLVEILKLGERLT